MKILRHVSWLAALGAFVLTSGAAQAAVSVSAGNASAVPGGQAATTLTFAFDAPYDFTTLTLFVDYDDNLLTLNTGLSTVAFNAVDPLYSIPQTGYQTVLAALALNPAFSAVPNDAAGSYSLSALYNPGSSYPLPIGSLVIKGVFDLKPAFLAGMSTGIDIRGSMTSTAADVDPFPEDTFGDFGNPGDVPVIATISAVPEPETWLLLLGGLGLVGARAVRRKTSARQ